MGRLGKQQRKGNYMTRHSHPSGRMMDGGTIGGYEKDKRSNTSAYLFPVRARARNLRQIVRAVTLQAGDGQIGRDLIAVVDGTMRELKCGSNYRDYWSLLCLQVNLNTFFNLAEYVKANAGRCGFRSPPAVFCHMAELVRDRFRGSWSTLDEFVRFVGRNFYAPSALDEIDAAVREELSLTGGESAYYPAWLYVNLKRGIASSLDTAYEALSLARQGYAHSAAGLFYTIAKTTLK